MSTRERRGEGEQAQGPPVRSTPWYDCSIWSKHLHIVCTYSHISSAYACLLAGSLPCQTSHAPVDFLLIDASHRKLGRIINTVRKEHRPAVSVPQHSVAARMKCRSWQKMP